MHISCKVSFRDVTGCGFHTKNLSDTDLWPDQNLLVPAIIATVIQLSYFCVHL